LASWWSSAAGGLGSVLRAPIRLIRWIQCLRVDENTDWMLCGFEIPFAAVPVPVGSVGWVWGALAVGLFQSLTCPSLETLQP